jgi:hypothetical protein
MITLKTAYIDSLIGTIFRNFPPVYQGSRLKNLSPLLTWTAALQVTGQMAAWCYATYGHDPTERSNCGKADTNSLKKVPRSSPWAHHSSSSIETLYPTVDNSSVWVLLRQNCIQLRKGDRCGAIRLTIHHCRRETSQLVGLHPVVEMNLIVARAPAVICRSSGEVI